jgi:nucleoside-diphosphate-sugar epimerase
MPQRVLLIGATGRLGRHFVDALTEKEYQVVALVRTGTQGASSDQRPLLDRFEGNGPTLALCRRSLLRHRSVARRPQPAVLSHRPQASLPSDPLYRSQKTWESSESSGRLHSS